MDKMKNSCGYLLLFAGAWALTAPQASLGLTELRWMARTSFPGEALLGIALLVFSQYLLGKTPAEQISAGTNSHHSSAE
jgi:hypothetical protein